MSWKTKYKVSYRISPDIRGGGICALTVCPNNQEKTSDKVLDICEAVIPTFAGKAHEFIDVVHRLGKVRSENALSSGQKPRGIILQFTMRHFRDALWKAAKNYPYLAKHHLRFAEDLSPEDREQRNKLWPLD